MHVWRPEIDVEYLSVISLHLKKKKDLSLITPQSSISQKLQCIFFYLKQNHKLWLIYICISVTGKVEIELLGKLKELSFG